MSESNINDASDKLQFIDDKIGFITHMIMNLNVDFYSFNKDDIIGLSLILSDLHDEIREVKELLD